MVKMIVKVKGKKGIVTHTWEGTQKDVNFFKKKKVMPATSNRDYIRYGGKNAKIISVKLQKSKPKRPSNNMGFNVNYNPF